MNRKTALSLTGEQLLTSPKRQRATQALTRIENETFPEILARIRAGESQTEIASSLNVHVATLSRYLSDPSRVVETAAAKADSAEAWLDRGMKELEAAKGQDNAEVARARAVAQECSRRAAIRNPRYSDRAAVELSGPDGAQLAAPQQAVIVYMPVNGRD